MFQTVRYTALPALILALLSATAIAAEAPPGLHVTGSGEVRVVPDMARVTLEVRREGEDAAALKQELDAVTERLLDLTDELGIERRDVTAAVVNVYPRYHHPRDDQPEPSGLIASRTVEVTVRDLEDLGVLINDSLERGANGVHGVTLDASNRPELESQALDLAIDDARQKAQQMAERFNVSLGELLDARSGQQTVQPFQVDRMELRAAEGDVAPGEMKIQHHVEATFGIGN